MRLALSTAIVLFTLFSLPALTHAQAETPEAYDQDADGENRAKTGAADLIGQPGPARTLKTINGETIDLLSFYGNTPVYLKFWATWCVPCRQQMPGFEETFQEYGDKVKVIAVNTGFNDSEKAIREYQKKIPMLMPTVIDDGTLAGDLNLTVTPMHVLISRDGRIAYIGHKDGEQLHAALKAVIAQTPQAKVPQSDAAKAAKNTEAAYVKTPKFNVGDTVKGLTFTTLDNQTAPLNGTSEKPKALVFLAPWCESYLAESRPKMAQNCERVRKQVDALINSTALDWYGISSNLWVNKQEVADYQKSTGTKLPLIYDNDGELFRAFSVRQIPTIILIDKSGKVSKVIDPHTASVEAALDSASL